MYTEIPCLSTGWDPVWPWIIPKFPHSLIHCSCFGTKVSSSHGLIAGGSPVAARNLALAEWWTNHVFHIPVHWKWLLIYQSSKNLHLGNQILYSLPHLCHAISKRLQTYSYWLKACKGVQSSGEVLPFYYYKTLTRCSETKGTTKEKVCTCYLETLIFL